MNFDWTEERVARLRWLWSRGESGGRIAHLLGCPSRSAVIGKAHRLGLMSRATSTRVKPPHRPRTKIAFRPDIKRTWPVEPLPPDHVDDVARKSLLDLEDEDCRFIVGDPKQVVVCYCALPKVPGSSFCRGHHQRVWTSVPVRRKTSDPSAPVRTNQPVEA